MNVPESPTPGVYAHYKGGLYSVYGVAVKSGTEDEEPAFVVVYRPRYGHRFLTIRPLAEFMETITVDGKEEKRFLKVGNFEQDPLIPRKEFEDS